MVWGEEKEDAANSSDVEMGVFQSTILENGRSHPKWNDDMEVVPSCDRSEGESEITGSGQEGREVAGGGTKTTELGMESERDQNHENGNAVKVANVVR
jgi:hypothetical protein